MTNYVADSVIFTVIILITFILLSVLDGRDIERQVKEEFHLSGNK